MGCLVSQNGQSDELFSLKMTNQYEHSAERVCKNVMIYSKKDKSTGFFEKLKPEGISKNDSNIIWRT